jgi:hypothetical protein
MGEDAQTIFFEGMLMEEGLGKFLVFLVLLIRKSLRLLTSKTSEQVKINRGLEDRVGVTQIIFGSLLVHEFMAKGARIQLIDPRHTAKHY